MPYPQVLFDLQLTFARKITALSQRPYQEVVLRDTAMYRILGLDWAFDTAHPVWQAYLQGLRHEQGDADWSHQFYLARYDQLPKHPTPNWGCFAYDYSPEAQVIHIHFANVDTSGYGPLSSQRRAARLEELRSMFISIKQAHPDASEVRGGSWLYNRSAYKRLFPPEYGASALPDRPHLAACALWGQFLRHDEQINEENARLFLQRLSVLEEVDQYAQYFPYQVLLTRAPIDLFYRFYGID